MAKRNHEELAETAQRGFDQETGLHFGFFHADGSPIDQASPPPSLRRPRHLLAFCRRWRKKLAGRPPLESTVRLIGANLFRDVWGAMRAMGAADVPPQPDPPGTVGEFQRGLDSVIKWCASDEAKQLERRRGGKKSPEPAGKRSWTQPELDEAIEKYKVGRSANFSELVERVAKGSRGAKKAAQEMFGRNAVARALGARSPTMVGKSPVWREIRDALGLGRTSRGAKIGHDVAVESQSVARGDVTVEEASRRETLSRIETELSAATTPGEKDSLSAIRDRLESGTMSDDEARKTLELFGDQTEDSRSRKVHGER